MDPGSEIRSRLRSLGLRGAAYLVGGTVRDQLLDRPVRDIDCATEDSPEVVARSFSEMNGGTFVALDPVHELFRVVAGGRTYDFSRLHPDGITADLARRDFSINAMARCLDASPSFILDPFGGRSDLTRRSLRMVTEANLIADPLRVLRAYRLRAELGFRIEGDTRSALARQAHLIPKAAAERITEEWRLLLANEYSADTVRLMAEDGALTVLWPELDICPDVVQSSMHPSDVIEHSLATLKNLEQLLRERTGATTAGDRILSQFRTRPWRLPILKTAAILHDIGKPGAEKRSRRGEQTFPRHERIGVEFLTDALTSWCFSRKEEKLLARLIGCHRGLFMLATAQLSGRLRSSTTFFWLARWKEDIHELFLLACADYPPASGPRIPVDAAEFIRFGESLVARYHDTVQPRLAATPLVTGWDLQNVFELCPGPEFGKILREVGREVLAGNIRTREGALEWIATRIGKEPT